MTSKISGLDDEEFDILEEDEENRERLCDGCQNYELCYNDNELPNYINCFLNEDEDEFFESDDEKKTYIWKEMSYNKYTEH